MSVATPSKQRFIGRQAIFDEKMGLYGYELLFRSGTENAFSGDIEDATNQIIDSCLSMIACSSCQNLFVNCTRNALVNMSVKLLPSRTVVLEILETVPADAELVKACKELKQAGFRLALDDFSPYENKGELVEIVDYVKVDFRASDAAERQEIYKMFGKKTSSWRRKSKRWLRCEPHKRKATRSFKVISMLDRRLLQKRKYLPARPSISSFLPHWLIPPWITKKIERLLLMEPSLCYRLLRLANSAIYGLRHRISTIQAALNTVGEDAFRKLVTVVLASNLSASAVDRDAEQALERAFLCESLAPILHENAAELYMLGMLSMMDRMLNIPMKQLVDLISIDSRIQEALLGSAKGMGRALALCEYEERGGDSQGLPHPVEW